MTHPRRIAANSLPSTLTYRRCMHKTAVNAAGKLGRQSLVAYKFRNHTPSLVR
jgi:hypothetical protein